MINMLKSLLFGKKAKRCPADDAFLRKSDPIIVAVYKNLLNLDLDIYLSQHSIFLDKKFKKKGYEIIKLIRITMKNDKIILSTRYSNARKHVFHTYSIADPDMIDKIIVNINEI